MSFPTKSTGIALRRLLVLVAVLVLAGCAQQAGSRQQQFGGVPYDGYDPNAPTSRYAPSRYYPPPGPANDPWGPYIREAASRYHVPDQWIRAVMRQESGGHEQAVSSAGAMGLMQVMPATYEELRRRHNLGADPYDPHNNILAGTAYIKEMYDQFGAPGFLAAYNAGPDRLNSYLAGTNDLPRETVNYLASITPNLGREVPFSGPLAVYATNNRGIYGGYGRQAPTVASLASGCDVNAAYDPDRPCKPLVDQAYQSVPQAPVQQPVRMATAAGCDPDAAYDPSRPCARLAQPSYAPPAPSYGPAPAPQALAPQALAPRLAYATPPQPPIPPTPRPAEQHYLSLPSSYSTPGHVTMVTAAAPPGGDWAIQVGAFANPGLARAVAEGARAEAPAQLRSAGFAFPPTAPFGGNVLYRARIVHLTASAANSACQQLNQRQLPCIVVPPTAS